MLSTLYNIPTIATNIAGKIKVLKPFFPKKTKIRKQKITEKKRYSKAIGIESEKGTPLWAAQSAIEEFSPNKFSAIR